MTVYLCFFLMVPNEHRGPSTRSAYLVNVEQKLVWCMGGGAGAVTDKGVYTREPWTVYKTRATCPHTAMISVSN